MKRPAAVLVLCLLAGALTAKEPGVIFPGVDWEKRSPAEVEMREVPLAEMASYLGGRGMVVRHGVQVFTWGDVEKRGDIASAAKPIYTHFLLKAVEEGKVNSVDARLSAFEPEIEALNAALGFKDREITFRHLANQTSCYGVRERPGTAFNYNDWQTALFWDALFSEVWKVARENIDAELFGPLLTGPLGCQDRPTMMAFGEKERAGRVAISPRDHCRFGLLYLRHGQWRDQRLLSAEHVRLATTSPLPLTIPRTRAERADMIAGQRTIGSKDIPDDHCDHLGSYSFMWWVNGVRPSGKRLWPDAPPDTFASLGHTNGKRGLVIIPSLDLVMAWNDTTLDKKPWAEPGIDPPPLNTALGLLVSAASPVK